MIIEMPAMSSQTLFASAIALCALLFALWIGGGLVAVLFAAALFDLGLTLFARRRMRHGRVADLPTDRR